MKVVLRLFRYFLPYHTKVFLGILASFFLTIFNALSLSFFIPLFDALGEKSEIYLFQFNKQERSILELSSGITLPTSPKKIDATLAKKLLQNLNETENNIKKTNELRAPSIYEKILLKTLIFWKLKFNTMALSPLHLIIFLCLFILPCWAIKLILSIFCLQLISKIGYLAVRNLRSELYFKMQHLPLNWFHRNKSGDLASRVSNDGEVIAACFADVVRESIINIFYLLTHGFILVYLNWKLLLASIVLFPVLLFPISIFIRKIRSSTNRSQNILSELHGHLQETLTGMKVIRTLQMEVVRTQKFLEVIKNLYWRRFKEIYYHNLGPNIVELNSILLTLSFLALGVFFLEPTEFTRGEFINFIMVLLFLVRPIVQLSTMVSSFQPAISSASRIFAIMDMKLETTESQVTHKYKTLEKEIIFENISFSYPETEALVLENISFKVKKGETVAIVGESGCGKSTLMDVFTRFYKPTSGRILFDGIDIQDFEINEYRKNISLVSQDVFLFHESVLKNISLGEKKHSINEIVKATKLAHAHEFIKKLDYGYYTIVGNRGSKLSGGQRQRIAIARALLLDSEILILDEATSSLDFQTEQLVQNALQELLKNKTIFVVAHRLSTIEKADKILVLSKGGIVEEGNHQSLLSKNGFYANLHKINTYENS